jgi:pilus assembly protein CpaF
MRPDRIIVGEVRGPEALDMIQSMNTGHDGSMSTGHANSPEDMLSRLETMILMGTDMPLRAIRKQIASSIDVIVQLGRLRDRSRRVIEITEILDCEGDEYMLNPLFQFHETDDMLRETAVYGDGELQRVSGRLERTAFQLKNRRKLRAAALAWPEM